MSIEYNRSIFCKKIASILLQRTIIFRGLVFLIIALGVCSVPTASVNRTMELVWECQIAPGKSVTRVQAMQSKASVLSITTPRIGLYCTRNRYMY
jgi:hypothetical protein